MKENNQRYVFISQSFLAMVDEYILKEVILNRKNSLRLQNIVLDILFQAN